MKRQINLYGAEFHPKRQWASLNQMVLAWGVALLVILLVGAGYGWQQHSVSRALAQVNAELALKRSDSMPIWRAIWPIRLCSSSCSTSRMIWGPDRSCCASWAPYPCKNRRGMPE